MAAQMLYGARAATCSRSTWLCLSSACATLSSLWQRLLALLPLVRLLTLARSSCRWKLLKQKCTLHPSKLLSMLSQTFEKPLGVHYKEDEHILATMLRRPS